MHRRKHRQLTLAIPPTWGGKRKGAGRKPTHARPGPLHKTRPPHNARHPVHVTLRAASGIPSLRGEIVFAALRDALKASGRAAFRLLHFSVQSDHMHLVVEADSREALVRGLQGLAVRCARAVNRIQRRRGPVWSDRYHARNLGTPREVRVALTYVLLNFRKHLRAPPGIDPCSSGPWFDGWARPPRKSVAINPTHASKTWLGAFGWRRAGGPIRVHEAPAALGGL